MDRSENVELTPLENSFNIIVGHYWKDEDTKDLERAWVLYHIPAEAMGQA